MTHTTSWLVTAASLCLPLVAAAQADPADPGAPGRALAYPSAFADYQPWQDVPAGDWKALNEAVKVGGTSQGHAGHGAPPAPDAAAPATKAAPAAPAMHGHGGHPMPGDRK